MDYDFLTSILYIVSTFNCANDWLGAPPAASERVNEGGFGGELEREETSNNMINNKNY